MIITCPDCLATYPISAGLLTDDAKALAIRLVDAPRDLARAALAYLRLHKPLKRALSASRSCALVGELLDLAQAASVDFDAQGAVPNNAQLWIETMVELVAKPPRELPLANTNYLRAIVYKRAAMIEIDARKVALNHIDREHKERELKARNGRREELPTSVNPQFVAELAALTKSFKSPV